MTKSERYKNLQAGYQIIEGYDFTFYQLSFGTHTKVTVYREIIEPKLVNSTKLILILI